MSWIIITMSRAAQHARVVSRSDRRRPSRHDRRKPGGTDDRPDDQPGQAAPPPRVEAFALGAHRFHLPTSQETTTVIGDLPRSTSPPGSPLENETFARNEKFTHGGETRRTTRVDALGHERPSRTKNTFLGRLSGDSPAGCRPLVPSARGQQDSPSQPFTKVHVLQLEPDLMGFRRIRVAGFDGE